MTMRRFDVDRALIGQQGGRWLIETPALVVDLDRLEANIAAMATHCRAAGIALRPHAKTHKSVEIARRQIAAGALGQCCAKLGEAEALAEGGIDGLLITSPIVSRAAVARVVALNARARDLMLVVDSATSVDDLGEAAAGAGQALKLLVDVDVGLRRTGVAPGVAAVELAARIAAHPALRFVGLQGYAGHLMHVSGRDERRARSLEALDQLAATRDLLLQRGLAPAIITGGGTGTFDIDPGAGVLTELQAGSYVFMDREYNDVWRADGAAAPFVTSLSVQTTVISANAPGLATTDGGYKAFATDAGPPDILSGAPDGAKYFFFGDEHGGLTLARAEDRIATGAVVVCDAPHCDPTVNLYDAYHVVRGDTLVSLWPIEARGASR